MDFCPSQMVHEAVSSTSFTENTNYITNCYFQDTIYLSVKELPSMSSLFWPYLIWEFGQIIRFHTHGKSYHKILPSGGIS